MKALILYTNTGAGHVSAGKSLCHELRNLDIETIELDTLNFPLAFLFIQNLVNI